MAHFIVSCKLLNYAWQLPQGMPFFLSWLIVISIVSIGTCNLIWCNPIWFVWFLGTLEELVKHGLRALRDTLPNDVDLTTKVAFHFVTLLVVVWYCIEISITYSRISGNYEETYSSLVEHGSQWLQCSTQNTEFGFYHLLRWFTVQEPWACLSPTIAQCHWLMLNS